MDPDKWDVFLDQYQALQDKLKRYEDAVDYAIGKLGKQDMEGYIEEIELILGETNE